MASAQKFQLFLVGYKSDLDIPTGDETDRSRIEWPRGASGSRARAQVKSGERFAGVPFVVELRVDRGNSVSRNITFALTRRKHIQPCGGSAACRFTSLNGARENCRIRVIYRYRNRARVDIQTIVYYCDILWTNTKRIKEEFLHTQCIEYFFSRKYPYENFTKRTIRRSRISLLFFTSA